MTTDPRKLAFGFVGTGTITEAVVTGLCKTEFLDTKIVLSPRSEEIAARLAVAHGNVMVADGNQDVVDRSDLVFIAVRPQIAEDVVSDLRFRPDHHVISFVAATPLDRLLFSHRNFPQEHNVRAVGDCNFCFAKDARLCINEVGSPLGCHRYFGRS